MRQIRSLQVSVDPSLDRVHNRSEMIARARQWAWSRAQSLPPTGYYTRVGTIAGPYGIPTLASDCLPSPVVITVQGDYFPDQSARLTIGALYCPAEEVGCVGSWGTEFSDGSVQGIGFHKQGFENFGVQDAVFDASSAIPGNFFFFHYWISGCVTPATYRTRWRYSILSGGFLFQDIIVYFSKDAAFVRNLTEDIGTAMSPVNLVNFKIALTCEVFFTPESVTPDETFTPTLEVVNA